jgi:predicted component of type VI protein secretion system
MVTPLQCLGTTVDVEEGPTVVSGATQEKKKEQRSRQQTVCRQGWTRTTRLVVTRRNAQHARMVQRYRRRSPACVHALH